MILDAKELSDLIGAIPDVFPAPTFVVDADVRIIWANRAGFRMLGAEPEMAIRRRAGEILHCLHSQESPEGCGFGAFCQDCPVKASVTESLQGQEVVRRRAHMELISNGVVSDIYLLVTTAPFSHRDDSLVLLILEDISELMALKNILPICSYCKKIRNDAEYWQNVETYFKSHLDLDFTHGICPECAAEVFHSKEMARGGREE